MIFFLINLIDPEIIDNYLYDNAPRCAHCGTISITVCDECGECADCCQCGEWPECPYADEDPRAPLWYRHTAAAMRFEARLFWEE